MWSRIGHSKGCTYMHAHTDARHCLPALTCLIHLLLCLWVLSHTRVLLHTTSGRVRPRCCHVVARITSSNTRDVAAAFFSNLGAAPAFTYELLLPDEYESAILANIAEEPRYGAVSTLTAVLKGSIGCLPTPLPDSATLFTGLCFAVCVFADVSSVLKSVT